MEPSIAASNLSIDLDCPEANSGKHLATRPLTSKDFIEDLARRRPPYEESDLSVVDTLIVFAMTELFSWFLFRDKQTIELCFFFKSPA